MIKNIVFDIGNVLTDYCYQDFVRAFGYPEEINERIWKAAMLSSQWDETDRGFLNREELIELFVQNDPGIREELHTVLANLKGLVVPVAYAIPWVQELQAKGYGVYYLSNFSEMAHIECEDALRFIPIMDGGILSYQDHVIKPDAAIYQLLFSRFGLVPEECVFLDDRQENVDAAVANGMHAILFTGKEAAEAELAKLGVS